MELNKNTIFKISVSGVLLAIGMVLPFLTGQIPEIGKMLCPMHIPVLICGFLCGWKYGLLIGFTLPLLRSLIFSVPVFFPNAWGMAFEMGTYGFLAGFFSNKINNIYKLYLFLIFSMLGGRLIWGLIMSIFMNINNSSFTFKAFLGGAFINAWPGIILQLIVVPILTYTINKIKFKK